MTKETQLCLFIVCIFIIYSFKVSKFIIQFYK